MKNIVVLTVLLVCAGCVIEQPKVKFTVIFKDSFHPLEVHQSQIVDSFDARKISKDRTFMDSNEYNDIYPYYSYERILGLGHLYKIGTTLKTQYNIYLVQRDSMLDFGKNNWGTTFKMYMIKDSNSPLEVWPTDVVSINEKSPEFVRWYNPRNFNILIKDDLMAQKGITPSLVDNYVRAYFTLASCSFSDSSIGIEKKVFLIEHFSQIPNERNRIIADSIKKMIAPIMVQVKNRSYEAIFYAWEKGSLFKGTILFSNEGILSISASKVANYVGTWEIN